MKTLVKPTALLITLTVLISTSLMASLFEFADETYIDDIPFDTECISSESLYEAALLVDYQLSDEEYIDDIPFNTKCISINCHYNKAMKVEFNFYEEEYINDVPFNTKSISLSNLHHK